jgi:glycosyltransferase involved in cell wall biosynthesis
MAAQIQAGLVNKDLQIRPQTQKVRALVIANFLSGRPGTRSAAEDLVVNLERLGCEFICASHFRPGWLRGLHMLWVAVTQSKKYDVAVVDLYSGKAFLWGEALSLLLPRLGRPFAFILRGGALPDYAKSRRKRVMACLRRASRVYAPSSYLLEHMRSYRSGMELLPNAIDLARYPFNLRRSPGPRLVWLRAFHNIYNPQLAPKVIQLLVSEFPEIQLAMYGPDKGDGSLQQTRATAASEKVSDRIIFAGPAPKSSVGSKLADSDIFINTTDVDNTPVSVIEAMACGLCIVSTNVGGLPFLLEHEKDALLVPPNDAAAMAAAVKRVLTEEGLAERLSRNARKKAAGLDWVEIMPLWHGLFQNLTSLTYRP